MDNRTVDVICCDTSKNCAIKLDGVFCDGYRQDGQIGVFSHFHHDHMKSVHQCISRYDVLIAHPLTFEGINTLKPGMRHREQWVTQSFDTKYKYSGGKVSLLKANHIPGSSQVYVESDKGLTMLYSGDFGFPDLQIKEADYLVLDSTHGDPWHDGETDRRSIKNRMFEHVEEQLGLHLKIVVMAAAGTLQEIVRHFEVGYGRKLPDDVVFVMDEKQAQLLHNLYKPEQKEFRDPILYDSVEFWDLQRSGKKCVIFSTQLDTDMLGSELSGLYKIIVDKYRFSKDQNLPMTLFDGGCRFNLAAHTSINGIYDYVESVKPKYVITDNSRSGYAKQLAKLIEQKFPHIKTESRPLGV